METVDVFLSFTECTYGNDDKHDFKNKKMVLINHNAFMGLYSVCKLFERIVNKCFYLFTFVCFVEVIL